MTKIDLSHMVPEKIDFNLTDLRNWLVPVMHQMSASKNTRELKEWAVTRIEELRERPADPLPLEAMIKKIRNEGIASPELMNR